MTSKIQYCWLFCLGSIAAHGATALQPSFSHTIVIRDHLKGISSERTISAKTWDSTACAWTGSDAQQGIKGLPTPDPIWYPTSYVNRRSLSPTNPIVGWPGRICVRVDRPPPFRLDTSVQRCSGALVGPHFVLTAAHCVVEPFTQGTIQEGWVTDTVLIRPGFNLKQDAPGFGRVRVVRSYVSKSKFDSGTPYAGDNEWALLELDQDVGTHLGWARVTPIDYLHPAQMVHAMGYPLIPRPCGGDPNCDTGTKTDTLMHSWQELDYNSVTGPSQEWWPTVPSWEGESGSGYFNCSDDSCRLGSINIIGVRWTESAISSIDSVMSGVMAAILKDDVKIPPASLATRDPESFGLYLKGGSLHAIADREGEWQIQSLDGRAVCPPTFGRNLSIPADRLPHGVALIVFRAPGHAPITRQWMGR